MSSEKTNIFSAMMSIKTLSSGTKVARYMPMTTKAIPCQAPILPPDFAHCRVPGGLALWEEGGFYSPGQCFEGYQPQCTQVTEPQGGWPIQQGETAVRCIPFGYECNEQREDQRYARTKFGESILSAPAFEIRWRGKDLSRATRESASLPSDSEIWPSSTITIGTDADTKAVDFTTQMAEPTTHTPLPKDGNPSGKVVAGITTGVVMAILVLLAIVVMVSKKGRRPATRESANSASDEAQRNAASQGQNQRQEAGSGPVELSHDVTSPPELGSTQPIGVCRLTDYVEAGAGCRGPGYAESAPAELSGETRYEATADVTDSNGQR